MTVSELIELLNRHDPSSKVLLRLYDSGDYYNEEINWVYQNDAKEVIIE